MHAGMEGSLQRGRGGWLKKRYEAAVRGAVGRVSKEIHDQGAKRTYCGSEYSEDTNPGSWRRPEARQIVLNNTF